MMSQTPSKPNSVESTAPTRASSSETEGRNLMKSINTDTAKITESESANNKDESEEVESMAQKET